MVVGEHTADVVKRRGSPSVVQSSGCEFLFADQHAATVAYILSGDNLWRYRRIDGLLARSQADSQCQDYQPEDDDSTRRQLSFFHYKTPRF